MRPANRPRPTVVGLALILAIAAAPVAITAPGTARAAGAEAPPPEACRVDRRSAAELAVLAATPSPDRPPASPPARSFAPPPGDPIEAEAVMAITATQRQALACANAGDLARVLSLYSDPFVRRILAEAAAHGTSPQELLDRSTPAQPLQPNDRAELLAVRQGRLLADGRVGALVDTVPASAAAVVEVNFVWFTEGRDGWLIDDLVLVEIVDLAATPTGAG